MRTERVAVLTGATSGLGRWIGLGLSGAGLRLLAVGRDQARLAALRAWIARRNPDAQVETLQADLSRLAETRAVGARILARAPRPMLLVNNAGLLSAERVVTGEGFERTLAVNHLSPFLLARLLLPGLLGAPGGRVVNVGSSTSDRAALALDDLQLEHGWRMTRAYARSKLALLMASRALAWDTQGQGLDVLVAHPGMVATSLVREPASARAAWRLMAPFLLSESEGAVTPLHAALSLRVAGVSFAYLKRCRPVAPNWRARSPALCRALVAETERLLRSYLD